jgi:hypothetical protein
MVNLSLVRLSSLALALVFALTLAPEHASAKKRKKSKKPVVALFLSAKNKPNGKLYGSLLNELTKSAGKARPVKILYGKNLRKVIKTKPEKAIGKCGSNVACIAKLGQKARADTVVYGRVSPSGGGIKAQLLVVDVASQSISERMALSMTSVSDVETQIAGKLELLFPTGTAMAAGDEIPLDMMFGEEPVAATAAADPTEPSDELPLDFTLGGGEPEATETVAAAEPDPVDDLELAPPPPPTTPETIAAVSPELAGTSGGSETSSGGSRALTYTGIAVAGLGVAALGVGGYFGMTSSSTVDSIEYGPDGTTQLKAKDIESDANDQASMANLMFGVGGGLVGVGALLVALDLFVLDGGSTPETSVSVGANAAAATFTWKF